MLVLTGMDQLAREVAIAANIAAERDIPSPRDRLAEQWSVRRVQEFGASSPCRRIRASALRDEMCIADDC